MVCSEKELGISDSHEGVMILPPNAPLGVALADYIGDSILDLDITPNRPDLLSIIGIAHEVGALTNRKVSVPSISYTESRTDINKLVSVEIVDPDLCRRYCASLVEDVTIGESPFWMQERLLACGMRPINNVVDITNYVMLEYGQPLHAFDFKLLRGGKIIVRRAGEGETITTLDDVDRKLDSEMLVIADTEVPVAVAGIMGGAESEVTEGTTAILLESANFNPATIRRGASILRLGSEASSRFEKMLSPDLTLPALERATQLLVELGGGKAAKGIVDVYPGKSEKMPIPISVAQASRLMGVEWSLDWIEQVLTSLEFECRRTGESQLEAVPPYWRTDIEQTADLVEEVARITGYDHVPIATLASLLPEQRRNAHLSMREQVRDIMVGCGFQEVINYSLTNRDCTDGMQYVRLANPMSAEYEYLRTTLRPSLMVTLAHNQKYDEGGIRIFEIGKVYEPRENDLPLERETLVAVLSGSRLQHSWVGEKGLVDFFDIKGVTETLLCTLGLEAEFGAATDGSLHPGRTADICVDGSKVGVVGELHPKLVKDFDLLDQPVGLFEIDLDKLLDCMATMRRFETLPRYPGSVRDLALIVDSSVAARSIQDIIVGFPLVRQVSIFDLYMGKQVPEGKKSIAFRILYQAIDRTLTDSDVNKVEQDILARLSRELGASVRG